MKAFIPLIFLALTILKSSAQNGVCFPDALGDESVFCNYEYCSADGAPFTFSSGIYRIPLLELTSVHVKQSVFSSCPRGWIELQGAGSLYTTHFVVAAADGWLRYNHDDGCVNPDDCANFVWLEHPNGEWTFYSNLAVGSIPDDYSWGDWITAGSIIGEDAIHYGTEDTFRRVLFQVTVPVDTDIILIDGNYGLPQDGKYERRIPLFCGVEDHQLHYGNDYTALSCGSTCNDVLPLLGATYGAGEFKAFINDGAVSTDNDLVFTEASSGLIQGSGSVTLNPGFEAGTLSTFEARTGDCSGADYNKTTASVNADVQIENSVSVYPNPASRTATLSWFMNEESSVKISVCDIEKREVFQTVNSERMNSGTHQQTFDVSALNPGVYLVVLEMNQSIKIQKLVVQK